MVVSQIWGWDFGKENYEGTKIHWLWSFDPKKIDASLKIVFPAFVGTTGP